MKVLFLIRALGRGGAERQLVALAGGLRRAGHDVSVAVFYSGGALEEDLRRAGVPILPLRKQSRWDVFGFLRSLIAIVRQERPDVVHGYLNVANILTILLPLWVPGIRVVCGVRASTMDFSKYDWLSAFLYRLECRLSRFATLIISNSECGARDAIGKGFPRDKMIVIANGIDTNRFHPDDDSRRRIRAEWGVADHQTLVGVVARLDPMKDHQTFLRAAAGVAKTDPDVVFVAVGEGRAQYTETLKASSRELGLGDRMLWAGARDDMPKLYNALDLLVSSSSFGEGFSNSIGEGMSCGVPCVATDVGDSGHIIGDTGEIVAAEDPEALRAAIEQTVRRIRGDRGARAAARARVVDRFSLARLIRDTDVVLTHLCAGAPAVRRAAGRQTPGAVIGLTSK